MVRRLTLDQRKRIEALEEELRLLKEENEKHVRHVMM
jgi:hypothetical protein